VFKRPLPKSLFFFGSHGNKPRRTEESITSISFSSWPFFSKR
jgi:hypothetical protein